MRYKEKGINYISCQNKITTDKITAIQHRANEVLFKIVGTHISKKLTEKSYSTLKECWIDLNNLEVPQKAKPKKDEILRKLKEQILLLRDIKDIEINKQDAQAVLNFNTSRAIAFKNEEHTAEEIVKKLAELKDVKDNFDALYQYLKVNTFESIKQELLDNLIAKVS